jgi:hypothetical protein
MESPPTGGARKKLEGLQQEVYEYLELKGTYEAALTQRKQLSPDGEVAPVALPTAPTPPESLVLYLECQQYHCLLVAGGILDQPVNLWREVRAAGNAYELGRLQVPVAAPDNAEVDQYAE